MPGDVTRLYPYGLLVLVPPEAEMFCRQPENQRMEKIITTGVRRILDKMSKMRKKLFEHFTASRCALKNTAEKSNLCRVVLRHLYLVPMTFYSNRKLVLSSFLFL